MKGPKPIKPVMITVERIPLDEERVTLKRKVLISFTRNKKTPKK